MLTMNLQFFAHKRVLVLLRMVEIPNPKRLGAKRADGQFVKKLAISFTDSVVLRFTQV